MAAHPQTLSVCSGIGGLDLGVHLALGSRTVGYVERSGEQAARIVARMGPEGLDPAPIWSDLTSFEGEPWRGRVDLLVGGIPCQPYSVAGSRKEGADPRDLVAAFCRVASEVRPSFIFLEEVSAFASWDGLGRCLGALSEIGFDAEWTNLRASDVGAPHRRERLFVLAYRRSLPDPGRILSNWIQHGGSASGCGPSDSGGNGEELAHAHGVLGQAGLRSTGASGGAEPTASGEELAHGHGGGSEVERVRREG